MYLVNAIARLVVILPLTTDFQPPELVSVDGSLNVTLDVGPVNSLEGIEWSQTGFRTAPGYNGGAVGPTLRVKPGDTLTVTLNNNLDPSPARDRELYAYALNPASDDANVTIVYNRLSAIDNIDAPEYGYWGFNFVNLHFHGMDFSPKMEDLQNYVDGGKSRTVTFKVPDNKEPGLYWYHNHVHGSCETWDVISDPPHAEHPFHIHQASFLVLAEDSVAREKPVWHDTIMIRENVTIQVCFDRAEPANKIMAHCHAATHFDLGMGTMFNVIAPPDGDAPMAAPTPTSASFDGDTLVHTIG